jgi:23S rRNA (pseudouridine1915-N3)-methyltransferase
VKIKIAWIGKTKQPAIETLTEEYLERISRYVQVEGIALRDEAALLALCGQSVAGKKVKLPAGGTPRLVIMDSRGKELTSEQFAEFLRDYRTSESRPLVFAVGGADGFSEQAKAASQFTFSLGRITLAHELARVVLLEQIYRAFTILKGHPYHSGH